MEVHGIVKMSASRELYNIFTVNRSQITTKMLAVVHMWNANTCSRHTRLLLGQFPQSRNSTERVCLVSGKASIVDLRTS